MSSSIYSNILVAIFFRAKTIEQQKTELREYTVDLNEIFCTFQFRTKLVI